jgi:phosphotransferase system IIB component
LRVIIDEKGGVNANRFHLTSNDGETILSEDQLRIIHLKHVGQTTSESFSVVIGSEDSTEVYEYIITYSPSFRIE